MLLLAEQELSGICDGRRKVCDDSRSDTRALGARSVVPEAIFGV